nr:putative late blight resistance protein homolog R1B-8 [Ipomoea batatas]
MESEIEDMTSQIETFRESLVVVCKSPMANEHCVLSVIVNKFERLVNEANDAVANYFAQEKKHGLAKAFDKIRLCGKLNNAASEILSIKEKAKIICEDHKEDLRHLWEYNKHSDQPPLKIETPIGFDKVIEKVEEAVNMLVQTVEDNVNLVSDIMESEIEGMISQIKTFTESLVVACKNPQASEHRLLRLIVKKFGTHVDEARDAVAKCYFAQEKKHGLAKAFDKIRLCGKLNNVASEIQSIKEKVKTICEDYNDLRHLWEDYNEHSDLPPLKVKRGIYVKNMVRSSETPYGFDKCDREELEEAVKHAEVQTVLEDNVNHGFLHYGVLRLEGNDLSNQNVMELVA